MTAPTPFPTAAPAALFRATEEARALVSGPASTPVLRLHPDNNRLFTTATAQAPAAFYNVAAGAPGLVFDTTGVLLHRMARAVAVNGRRCDVLNFPLLFRPAALPARSYKLRTYHFETVAYRDPLEAGSVFEVGLLSSTGSGQVVPSSAFVNYSGFAFRSLLAENGGLWQVWQRTGFGGAVVLHTTQFSATVPRTLAIDYAEGLAGGRLGFSIDGETVAEFGPADLPVIVAGNVPQWCPSFGNDSAVGAGFDYVVAGTSKYIISGTD